MSRNVRIEFDPNVRVYGNGSYACLDDVATNLAIHQEVTLYEPEEGIEVNATVTMFEGNFVYFAVDWDTVRRYTEQPASEAENVLVGASVVTGRKAGVFFGLEGPALTIGCAA